MYTEWIETIPLDIEKNDYKEEISVIENIFRREYHYVSRLDGKYSDFWENKGCLC